MKELKLIGRYRNKLNRIVAEVWNGSKWVHIKTLADPLKDFPQECLTKVSNSNPINESKEPQKCGQYLLSEPLELDTPIELSPEEAHKLALESEKESLLAGDEDD
jgi:hypothetical protein